jgi:hypothetical protein
MTGGGTSSTSSSLGGTGACLLAAIGVLILSTLPDALCQSYHAAGAPTPPSIDCFTSGCLQIVEAAFKPHLVIA